MKKIFATAILAIVTTSFISLAQRTTRKALTPIETTKETTIVKIADTIVPERSKLIIAGYDKPQRSNKETFLVTNKYQKEIIYLAITFDYYDLQKRQLHSSKIKIPCSIPSGETRLLSIPSWDKQKSYYYYLSSKPRTNATPYSVKYSVDSIAICR